MTWGCLQRDAPIFGVHYSLPLMWNITFKQIERQPNSETMAFSHITTSKTSYYRRGNSTKIARWSPPDERAPPQTMLVMGRHKTGKGYRAVFRWIFPRHARPFSRSCILIQIWSLYFMAPFLAPRCLKGRLYYPLWARCSTLKQQLFQGTFRR